MRYIPTLEWFGNKKLYGVWDHEKKKFINFEMDIDFRKTKKEAQADADRLNGLL
ncbi:hypothetical protein D3C75_406240 [compost metagenome]